MKKLLALFLFPLVAFSQGTPTVQYKTVADMVSASIPTVNNRLTALVIGRVSTNDGGGGVFSYQGGDSTSTNLGTVFKPSSATGRWIRQYSGELNVKWFGAVGDGTVNDTAAFTNAIQVASTNTGSIKIPAGTYSVTDLVMPSGGTVSLEGYTSQYIYDNTGTQRSILKARAGTTTLLSTVSTAASPFNRIANLLLDGNSIASTGLKVTGATEVENVTVRGCSVQGILGDGLNSATFRNVSSLLNTGYGMVVTNSAVVRSTKFVLDSCIFRENSLSGFYMLEGEHASFRDCLFESNTQNGVYLYKPTGIEFNNVEFINCWWENNGAAAVDDTRYQLLVDSQTRDTGSGPISYLRFSNCLFNNSVASQRCVNLISVRYPFFDQCAFLGGTAADNIQTGAFCSYAVFKDRNGGPTTISGANRSFDWRTEDSNSAGFTFGGMLDATSLYSPSLIGGRGTGSALSLQSTSGVGATDYIKFLVGNNGGTEAARIINSGNFGVNVSAPEATLEANGSFKVGSVAWPAALGKVSGRALIGAASGSAAVALIDDTAVAAGTGPAGVFFIARTTDVGPVFTVMGGITTTKLNSTQGNGAGNMQFSTHNGSALAAKWEMDYFGNLSGQAVGGGFKLKEGSNARMGQSTLVNGTVTVSNTSVTANTRIFLTRAVRAGTTVGVLGVGTVVAATSFVIESTDLAGSLSADDDSTVNWLLIEPSP